MTLENIIKRLPELYQNVYNHPEYEEQLKGCQDRLEML